MFCPKCGKENVDDAVSCVGCGRAIQNSSAPARSVNIQKNLSTKSRSTAGILGILLGGIGIHHFYIGNAGRGIIYLLLCWTMIPAIIGLIEGIQYLTMTDDAFALKFAK